MSQVIISIKDREYPIACEDGQEGRILQLARVVDEKAKSLGSGASQISEGLLLAMISLLLADELTEAKNGKTQQIPSINFTDLDKDLSTQIKKIASELKKDLQ